LSGCSLSPTSCIRAAILPRTASACRRDVQCTIG
jgi:hypothetical protein